MLIFRFKPSYLRCLCSPVHQDDFMESLELHLQPLPAATPLELAASQLSCS